jgi:hypothetical protein
MTLAWRIATALTFDARKSAGMARLYRGGRGAAADDRAYRCRDGGADERQGLPRESEGHGPVGSADRQRDAIRFRDALLRPFGLRLVLSLTLPFRLRRCF